MKPDILLLVDLRNSVERKPFLKANNASVTQETPRQLWSRKAHYRM
jgi:hypothetical protein